MTPTVKGLFSDMLSGKKLLMTFISLMLLIGVTIFLVFELSKTTVTLVIDGEEIIQKTHAKTVDELMIENDILVGEHDYIEPALETKLVSDLNVTWKPAVLVYLSNDSEKSSVWTTKSTVKELVQELKIEVSDYDEIKPALDSEIVNNMNIVYKSSFPVTLSSDGEEKEIWTTSTTVADFLEREEIILGELDRVEPAQQDIVKANSAINVIRVQKVTDVVEEPVNFGTVTRNDNSLDRGRERVVQSGEKGKVAKYYEVILENGEEVSRELIKTDTLKKSTDRIVAVGTRSPQIPVSRGGTPGDWVTFESTAYTAYCQGCSGITSTGLNLRAHPDKNVVAVDPNVIPLGSIVEVRHNGRIIGQYKAADVGSAIVGRKIDIFMPNRSDALRWGRQTVQVRIIK